MKPLTTSKARTLEINSGDKALKKNKNTFLAALRDILSGSTFPVSECPLPSRIESHESKTV